MNGTIDRFLLRRRALPGRLRVGLIALIGVAAWYGLAILLLALGGIGPGTAPWLAIPEDRYFYWESLFIGPVIVLTALLAAGVMHLVARALRGTGSFEDTVALLSVATALGTLCTVVPDTGIGLLLVVGIMDPSAWMYGVTHATPTLALVWVYLSAYLVAFALLYPSVARVVHDLKGWRPWALGWATFALYQFVLYVFIR